MNCRGTNTSFDNATDSLPTFFQRGQQTLNYYCFVEVLKQGKVGRLSIEGRARHEADELSAENFDITTYRSFAHGFECARDAGSFVINEVHRNLDHAATLQVKSQRFQKGQPTVTLAHFAGDAARD